MRITTYLMAEKCQSSGQLQKHCTTENIPPLAMSGVMAVCFTRYGVLDKNHLELCKIRRYSNDKIVLSSNFKFGLSKLTCIGCGQGCFRLQITTSPWLSQGHLQVND